MRLWPIFLFFLIISECICFASEREGTARPPLDISGQRTSAPGSPSSLQRPQTPNQRGALTSSTTSWDGDFYNTHGTLQQKWARITLSSHLFPKDPVVLDIGCGNGLVTQEEIFPLVREGNVTGIDPSEAMIRVAVDRTIPEELVFCLGSAEGTGFEPNTFDAVTCFSTLHWVRDKERAIREAARVLKPEGRYYVYMWVQKLSHDPIRQAFETTARSERWFDLLRPHGFFPEALPRIQGKFKEPYHMTKRDKIREYLKSAGFDILVWEPHQSDEVFENTEAFKNWLLGWSQFECLEDLHEAFLREVVEKYLEITEQAHDGEIRYHDAKLRFVARKKGAEVSAVYSE